MLATLQFWQLLTSIILDKTDFFFLNKSSFMFHKGKLIIDTILGVGVNFSLVGMTLRWH